MAPEMLFVLSQAVGFEFRFGCRPHLTADQDEVAIIRDEHEAVTSPIPCHLRSVGVTHASFETGLTSITPRDGNLSLAT